jgi:hypothetical protein
VGSNPAEKETTMALSATQNAYPTGQARVQNVTLFFGTLAFSGSYTTGGDTLTLPAVPGYDTSEVVDVLIHGISGYIYQYDKTNATVLVFEQDGTTGGLAQIGATTYPAGVTGDTVTFTAIVQNSVTS